MKLPLISLLSLTSIGSGLAPTIANLNSNTLNLKREIGVQHDAVTINLGERTGIITEDSSNSYKMTFPDWYDFENARYLKFNGEGLQFYINWGGDIYQYKLEQLEIVANNTYQQIWKHQYEAGISAVAKDEVGYKLDVIGHKYELTLYSATATYASFSRAWSNLTFGPSITLYN